MCGRFFVDAKNREIDRLVESLSPDSPPVSFGEIFPTNNALVINLEEGSPSPQSMLWGLPRWDKKGVIFNARSETALAKPMFRESLLNRPLVIPASGFYEWKKADGGGKEKYFFSAEVPLLYMAGFWKEIKDDLGEIRPYFTILTTAANDAMSGYHDRMPVLLREDEKLLWLNGKNREQILSREPFAVQARRADNFI